MNVSLQVQIHRVVYIRRTYIIIQNLVLASNILPRMFLFERILNTTCFASELLSVKFVFTEKETSTLHHTKNTALTKKAEFVPDLSINLVWCLKGLNT